jgi:hypothetical protein
MACPDCNKQTKQETTTLKSVQDKLVKEPKGYTEFA